MATVKIQNAGQFGIVRDVFAHELPPGAWSEGRNVRFGDGFVERMGGHQPLYGASSVEPYYVQPYSSGTDRFWIYPGLSKIYAANGGAHTNITRQTSGADVDYAATAAAGWTGNVLGGVAILNNSVDVPQAWGGSGRAQDLPNWPANVRCKALRNFKYQLIAMNITEGGVNYPHMYWWSHPADPGTVPASWALDDETVDSGRNSLSATPDRLIDGMTMADSFFMYKESSIYRLNYVGAPDIYRVSDPLSVQAGALATNCIAAFPGGHLVLGQGDIIINNGASIQSAISGRLRRWLQANIDSNSYAQSFLVTHRARSEIWVCIPVDEASTPNIALIWNWESNTWTFRELPAVHHAASATLSAAEIETFDGEVGTFDNGEPGAFNSTDFTPAADRLVIAGAGLYLADTTRTFNGTNYTAYVQREGMDFDMPDRMKLVKSIRPRIEGSGTVYVTVGGSNDLASQTTWGPARPFKIGSTFKVDTLQAWRYLAIRFSTTDETSWRLKSFDIEFEDAGEF